MMPTARLDGLRVDGDRLARELDTLAAFSDAPAPAVTRVVFGETDRKAREYVTSLCAEASLAVRTDAVGNTFARWRGTSPDLPAVATGSHIDAIPNAGRFDGTVGVLGGLEAIRALQRDSRRDAPSSWFCLRRKSQPDSGSAASAAGCCRVRSIRWWMTRCAMPTRAR
jgi:N-carbamoyl-L-amino-acid hydrolase